MHVKYLPEAGVLRPHVQIKCGNCGKRVWVSTRNGKPTKRFCSKRCSAAARRIERVTFTCAHCGTQVQRTPARKKSSRHGKYFCSRACKDLGQSIAYGCKEIWPTHYGSGNDYRAAAGRAMTKRCACGFAFEPLLAVHHIDGNRANNDVVNLEFVCPICHQLRHMYEHNGQWLFATTVLTPRVKLATLEQLVLGRVIHATKNQ